MNLLFLGLPGCGVRETARIASERLGLRFVDTDEVLTRNLSLSLQDVYSLFTPEALQDLLSRLALQLASGDGYCIAVGDCLLDDPGAMETLTAPGYTVLLDLLPEAAEEVCSEPEHPVLRRGLFRLKELYESRFGRLGSYADLVLNAAGRTPEALAEEAADRFSADRAAREAAVRREKDLEANRASLTSLLRERARLLGLSDAETERYIAAVLALPEQPGNGEEN